MIKKVKNKIVGLKNRSGRFFYLLPRRAAYGLFYTGKIRAYPSLSSGEKKLLAEPWYHNFGVLGVRTVQEPGIWRANQIAKQKPLFSYISRAIEICHERGTGSEGVELFCADGFYGNYAVQAGADHIHGVDLDDKNLAKARLMSKLLDTAGKARFDHMDVYKIEQSYDWGICAGGLYHIADPAGLLKMLTHRIKGPLVIQTVYSLANDSPDYFETPAPGWTWGSRFSHAYLTRMIEDAGWKILESTTNELKGNKRPEDRGSAYYLCMNKGSRA